MTTGQKTMVGSAKIAAVALIVFGVSPPELSSAPAIDGPLREALSGIDFVADKALFERLLGGEAASDLIEIARDVDGELDPGLRIRAYRALALYPQDTAGALLDAVDEHASALVTSGVEVIYAKAAMSSLATVSTVAPPATQALALAQFGSVLEHPLIDLRAAAARSLGKSGLDGGRPLLEARLLIEESELVRDAIRRALGLLGAAAL